MVKVIIEISHPPFGHENTFAGLYVASASLSKGYEVIVILRGDGVYAARKGQIKPQEMINLPSTESQVEDILELDGKVIVDSAALEERGISVDELIENIEVMDTIAIHDIILDEGEKVVTF